MGNRNKGNENNNKNSVLLEAIEMVNGKGRREKYDEFILYLLGPFWWIGRIGYNV